MLSKFRVLQFLGIKIFAKQTIRLGVGYVKKSLYL